MLDTKEDIVKKLLENSPRPSVLLMDRGFFKTEIIKLLESMGINFIMPAVRNERIKRMLNEFATFLLYMKWSQRKKIGQLISS